MKGSWDRRRRKRNAAPSLGFRRIVGWVMSCNGRPRHRGEALPTPLGAVDFRCTGHYRVDRARCKPGTLILIEHGRQAEEVGGRAAGRRAGGDASTLRSEGCIPRRSLRSGAAGCALCSSRDCTAISPCRRSQVPVAAGHAANGAMARTADTRRVHAHACTIRNCRRPGRCHSGPS